MPSFFQNEEKLDFCIPDPALNAQEQIVTNEFNSEVRDLLKKLPTSQRKVLVFRFFDEKSFKEIAFLQGVSINTALGRMGYALNNLRKDDRCRKIFK